MKILNHSFNEYNIMQIFFLPRINFQDIRQNILIYRSDLTTLEKLVLFTFFVVCSCHDGIIGFGVGTLGN
jgi:hypothetical protein